ncbi:MAG: prolyl oligopeptidase family serine peptidase [Verrucomicrobia bacterium]|nr:prolyl oligopeptidase family serine peptidase [Verrucomicrobiota bacterium]
MLPAAPIPSTFQRALHISLLFSLTALAAPAQGTGADYERAASLRRLTQNKVFRDRVQPHWLPGNTQFWYQVRTGPNTHEFIWVDAADGLRRPAFDHARLAAALTNAGLAAARADQLPLEKLEFKPGGEGLEFRAGGRRWHCDLPTCALRELAGAPEPPLAARPLDDAPRASQRTGEETWLTFFNRTAGEVELFWLDAEGERRSYGRLRAGESRRQHTFAGHVWLVADSAGRPLAVFEAEEGGATAEITGAPGARKPAWREGRPRRRDRGGPPHDTSPDGRWRAVVRDFNVIARNLDNGEEVALSSDGTAEDAYSDRFYWSSDSKKLVALRIRKGEEHKVHLIESSPKDRVEPRLHSFDYRKPGDRIDAPQPQLFDVAAERRIPVANTLFPNPWSISDVRWARDSTRFTFLYNQRGHQVLRIVAVNARTGEARALVDEQSATFIHYSGGLFAHYLDDTDELIWMSERSGWNHLYLYDARQGTVKHPITRGEWVVRSVERVDPDRREIWFTAGGIRPGQDPYYLHHARVNFDGTGLTLLTEGDGTHSVQFSPDRRFLLDTYSRVDRPAVTTLRRVADGALVCGVERGDAGALLASGWRVPEPFVAKGRDGATDIYGVIYRPSRFDPQQKYPVIEHIYAGPQGAFVPKAFSAVTRMQELAELGFIVVQIDGMGTAHRSKRFHDVCWQNLGDSGFPDRILWIKAAAAQYPSLDLTRVGIYGGSAGGQSALRALLAHGDFYHAAAADCGCHDNRMDKIWWNEQWMGWPVGKHYEEQSNVTHAHKLRGKLLLTVGELDRNVDPASTMQVVHALIRADKDFELVVFPGAGHGAGGSPYGRRRLQDFFVRHLLGVEPRR